MLQPLCTCVAGMAETHLRSAIGPGKLTDGYTVSWVTHRNGWMKPMVGFPTASLAALSLAIIAAQNGAEADVPPSQSQPEPSPGGLSGLLGL